MAAEAVIDRLGGLAPSGELGALSAQPALQLGNERPASLVARREALFGREAVDLALDGDQGIDALDRLGSVRRGVEEQAAAGVLLEPKQRSSADGTWAAAPGLDVHA